MERSGLFYVRFMDDILVLAQTRWRFRKAVTRVNEVLGRLHLEKRPEKTFIVDKPNGGYRVNSGKLDSVLLSLFNQRVETPTMKCWSVSLLAGGSNF